MMGNEPNILDKRAYLKRLIREKAANYTAYPISSAQKRIWMVDRLVSNRSAYNIHKSFEIKGELDKAHLSSSINLVIQDHQALRTTFSTIDDRPIQIVHKENLTGFKVKIYDLEDKTDSEQEQITRKILTQHANEIFDLGKLYLFSVILIRLSTLHHYLSFTYHHIITDGWSNKLIYSAISKYYSRFCKGIALMKGNQINYTDISKEQKNQENSFVFQKQLEFWRSKLKHVQFTKLSSDQTSFDNQDDTAGIQSLELDVALSSKSKLYCQSEHITPFVLFLTVFKVLLYRHTNLTDICVGIPLANRKIPGSEKVVGILLNTLAIRSTFEHLTTFKDLISLVKKDCALAYDNQDPPFEKIQQVAGISNDASHDSQIPILFNMLDLPPNSLNLEGLKVADLLMDVERPAKNEITFYVNPQSEKISITLSYKKVLFSNTYMKAFLCQYEMLLKSVIKDNSKAISKYGISIYNKQIPPGTESLAPFRHGLIHQHFILQAAQHPDRKALVFGEESWSYNQLDSNSNRLANYILKKIGSNKGLVCIYSKRSAQLICALIGVLKAGCSFVILDPDHPKPYNIDKLQQVILDGIIQIDIDAKDSIVSQIPTCNTGFFCLDISASTNKKTTEALRNYNTELSLVNIKEGDLAHVFFTSGTTGSSKAVKGKHGSVFHFLNWYLKKFPIQPSDRISFLSGISHDPMIRDVFVPLSSGATLYIPADNEIQNGTIAEWISRNTITVIHLTPSLAQVIVKELRYKKLHLESIKHIFFGGETLYPDIVSAIGFVAPQARLVNVYGTTETPQVMSYFTISSRGKKNEQQYPANIPIGKGIDDVEILIFNKSNLLCAVHEIGEICVRTKYLSDGYVGNEHLMDSRGFELNPLTGKSDDIIYRTGDLGKYDLKGNAVVLGREDDIVKIRGFRTNIQDVQLAIMNTSIVEKCTAFIQKTDSATDELVAYVVPKQTYTDQDLISKLHQKVPGYMIPRIILADELKLTSNGKIDKVSLKELPIPINEQIIAPIDEIERTLISIWAEVINIELKVIDRRSDFFALGGHSMIAIRLILKINRLFELQLKANLLYEFPTIEALASKIRALLDVEANDNYEEIEI